MSPLLLSIFVIEVLALWFTVVVFQDQIAAAIDRFRERLEEGL
jgi:hypothetical protein